MMFMFHSSACTQFRTLKLLELIQESETRRANFQQDWDNAMDALMFYGRETELTKLESYLEH